MKKTIVGIFALMLSFSALAEDGARGYWALGGGLLTFDDSVDQVKPIQMYGRLGYDFNQYIGIGGELGFSLIEDSAYGVDFSVTTTFFYVKGGMPLQDDAKIYVMFGPTNVELTGTYGGFSASTDDDDTGIGFGFEKGFGANAFTIDYITYYDKDGAEVYSINFGIASYF